MKDPLLIDLVGTDTNQIPDRIKNIAVLCNSDSQKHEVIRDFVMKNRGQKMLIFTDTKMEAQQFESKTYARFMPLHGDMNQNSRQSTMNRYRRPDCKDILVATDVAARGLDVNDIDVVVQFSVRNVDSLVHRTGRTGRAGKEGKNLILCSKKELPFMKQCERSLKINIDYQNSLGSNEEVNNQLMDKEISKMLENAHMPMNVRDNHVERLVDFYQKQDEQIKNTFFKNVMTQLILSKKILNSSPTIGMVTGRDNMKTFTFTTKRPFAVDPILRDLEIKFVREHNKDEDHSEYLIDLEPMSPHITTLSEHDSVEINLQEINLMPN